MKQYGYAVISVGSLPEWYDESYHDHLLEDAIEREWSKVAEEVKVEYNYNQSYVRIYDHDDNLVNERPTDLQYAFDFAEAN